MRKCRFTKPRDATTRLVLGIERLQVIPLSEMECYRRSFIAAAPVMMSVALVTIVIPLSVLHGILAAVSVSADSVYCAAEDAVTAHPARPSAAVKTVQQPQRFPVERIKSERVAYVLS